MKSLFVGSVAANIILAGILIYKLVNPPIVVPTMSYDCSSDTIYGLRVSEFMYNIARYKTTHYDSVNSENYMHRNGLEDARSCCYPLDSLKKFICLIEKYSSRLSTPIPHDSLGVRFYYSVYDSICKWNPPYKSEHTLFLVPTYKKGPMDIDFDPRYNAPSLDNLLDSAHFDSLLMALEVGRPGNYDHIILGNLQNQDATGFSKNQGHLCPPTCPPPSTLDEIDNYFLRQNLKVGFLTANPR
jgi:hypothetical protein